MHWDHIILSDVILALQLFLRYRYEKQFAFYDYYAGSDQHCTKNKDNTLKNNLLNNILFI